MCVIYKRADRANIYDEGWRNRDTNSLIYAFNRDGDSIPLFRDLILAMLNGLFSSHLLGIPPRYISYIFTIDNVVLITFTLTRHFRRKCCPRQAITKGV